MRLERQTGFVVGVKCDLCGVELEGDFTYYSLDIREVVVSGGRHTHNLNQLPIIFSLDACHKCVTDLGETIRIHYAPTKVGINCDLCGLQLRGDYTFYYINISAVGVDMNGGVLKCAACGIGLGVDKPCSCGADRPVKIATLAVNDKYLQVVTCSRDYTGLVDSAVALRQQLGTQG